MATIRQLREKKTARQSLLTLYGINRISAAKLIGICQLHPRVKYKNLFRNRDKFFFILNLLKIEYKLRVHVFARIMLLLVYKTYRGLRHAQKLPTRGQRTHTNAKSQQRLSLASKALPFKLATKHFIKTDRKKRGGKNITPSKNKTRSKLVVKKKKK
jgi:small subunit ribosomal protein S13